MQRRVGGQADIAAIGADRIIIAGGRRPCCRDGRRDRHRSRRRSSSVASRSPRSSAPSRSSRPGTRWVMLSISRPLSNVIRIASASVPLSMPMRSPARSPMPPRRWPRALSIVGRTARPSTVNRDRADLARARRAVRGVRRSIGDGGAGEIGQFGRLDARRHERSPWSGRSCRPGSSGRPRAGHWLPAPGSKSSSSLLSNHWILSGRSSRCAIAPAPARRRSRCRACRDDAPKAAADPRPDRLSAPRRRHAAGRVEGCEQRSRGAERRQPGSHGFLRLEI